MVQEVVEHNPHFMATVHTTARTVIQGLQFNKDFFSGHALIDVFVTDYGLTCHLDHVFVVHRMVVDNRDLVRQWVVGIMKPQVKFSFREARTPKKLFVMTINNNYGRLY